MSQIEEVFTANINKLIGSVFPKKLAIAVSGGADSVALLSLISKWAQDKNIPIYVLFVDHNLRAESKEEGRYVNGLATKLGHQFIGLSWQRTNASGNFQQQAREARYSLMSAECRKHGIELLMTAHHRNDMIENFLLRKARKSGLLGLSTSYINFFDNVKIIRPLFNIFKDRIIKYLIDNNIKWYEDASNESDKYQRNRIRKNIANYSDEEVQRIEGEMALSNHASLALEQNLIKAVAEIVDFKPYGAAKVDLDQFRLLENELQINLLSYVIAIISGANNLPRFRNLEIILAQINQKQNFKNTLHFCQLISKGKELLVHKEVAKIGEITLTLTDGVCWDNRLQFFCSGDLGDRFKIHKFDSKDYSFLKEQEIFDDITKLNDDFTQKSLLFTLPVIKEVEKIVAIPHIFYYDNSVLKGNLKVIFKPNFISRFLHF